MQFINVKIIFITTIYNSCNIKIGEYCNKNIKMEAFFAF